MSKDIKIIIEEPDIWYISDEEDHFMNERYYLDELSDNVMADLATENSSILNTVVNKRNSKELIKRKRK